MPKATATQKKSKGVSSKLFDALYAKLNKSQKKAVDTIEGPVMVVAGPGTGKTHTVALRTANILKKTQMRPSNILCLTFSVNAATEMRERLRSLIGPDAYGVTIKNFHAFCNELIQEYPAVFDDWSAMEQISDVERTREVNKIIDQLLPDIKLVNRKSPYLRTRQIISRISQLKREGKTDKDQLNKIADEYESAMNSKSKEGTKAHEKNLLSARKFREFLEVFFRYQEMLKKTQRYDYEDMILYVTQALEEEDWLLSGLQERYMYVLVDEFQDTNGAQYRLVELLTSFDNVDHEPNLFVVGDDDQAIYRFQGANLANILSFRDRFPSAPVITLAESFRCTQNILDSAGSLIEKNTERLVGKVDGLNKDLKSASGKEGPEINLVFSESDMTEPWCIAEMLQAKLKEGMNPEDIAVLDQTNKELQPIYEVLKASEIPVQMTGKVDLFSHTAVQQAISILRAVQSPKNSANLAGALGCECFGCHPADLGRAYMINYKSDLTLFEVLLLMDEDPDLELVRKDELMGAFFFILDLHNKLQSRTVIDTLEVLLRDSGLIGLDDPLEFAVLQEFFDRIKQRAYEEPSFSFESFLDDLSYYENPDYKDLRLSYSLPHLTESGINLMTAHQSKGLEFKTVIIPNFREGHWDKRRNPSSVSMPEDLLFGWEKDQRVFEKNQDERRVAYVAMTRAKEEVIFTCPKELTSGDKSREVSPSSFFAEAGDLNEKMHKLSDPESASLLLHTPDRDLDAEMKAFLKERLEDFALSVTALNHFLADPQMFLEIDLLRVPQAKKPSLVYGNAVHEAMKKWGLSAQKGSPLSSNEFVAEFKKYLDEREILTESERGGLKKVGEEALPRYYSQKLSEGHPFIYKVEYDVRSYLDDIPLKGKIDRIDLAAPDSSIATVIDFKTGVPKSEKQIRDDGDYFRQLTFYALLLECKGGPLEPQEFILEFIGENSDHPVTRSFTISQTDIDELKDVVRKVWEKITELDFTPVE